MINKNKKKAVIGESTTNMQKVINKAYFRIFCFTAVILLPWGPYSYAGPGTEIKLALIADKALDKSPLVSLLEVELSQKDDIQLLERAQIRQVLEEQELSLSGLLQRNRTIQVGQLLRADAFVLLSVEDSRSEDESQSTLLRVRVMETAHGLRLLDSYEELDDAKLEQTVEKITDKVIAIVPKMKLKPGEAIPVEIVDIHRVQLGERYQWLARSLSVMLSNRLSKEPRIIMLEREDLKILHDEKLLTEGEDTEFWGSAVLIDGYLQPSGATNIEMKLSVRRASGKEEAAFTVYVEPNEPWAAVDKVTTQIIQELQNAPPSASWQPKQEAEEFFHQGQLLKNHQRNEDARQPLETAHALQPENVYYTGGLFANEWDTRSLEIGSLYSDLELAELVSLLVRQMQKEYKSGSLSESYVLKEYGKPLVYESNYIRHPYINMAGYFARAVSVSTDKIRHINRENRKIWTETVKEAAKNWDGSPKQSTLLKFTAWVSSDDPEELIENLRETFSKLFMPREIGNGHRFMEARGALIFPRLNITRINELEKTHLKGSAKKFQELWLQYLEDLTKVSDPIVRFASYVALSQHYRPESHEAKNYNTAKKYCDAAMDVLLKELKSPNEPVGDMYDSDIDKYFIREAMWVALIVSDSMRDPEERLIIFSKIFNPLIEKSDARNIAIWHSVFRTDGLWYDVDDIKMAERYAHLMERIEALLKGSKEGSEITQLNRTKSHLTMLKRKFPQLQPSQEPRKFIAKMLLIKENWPGKSNTFKYTWMLLQENMLWIAFAEPGIRLAGIDLAKQTLMSLWQTDCPDGTTLYENMKSDKISGSITGMAICEDACYVAVRDIGLVKFPGSLRRDRAFLMPSRILTEKDGLPSVSITGMTAVNSKLWIAYGGIKKESGLIIYDPKNKTFDTVFCSTLDGPVPFGIGESYALSFLTPGPENKLFFILGERGFASQITVREQWWGLWKIDTKTLETKFLWRDDSKPMVFEAIQVSGNTWWLQDLYSITQFDPNSEKARFVLGQIEATHAWQTSILKSTDPMPELQRDLFVPESSIGEFGWGHLYNGYISLRTAAVYGNKLWACLGIRQIIIIHKGKGFDEAEVIDNNILDGDKVLRFFSTPYGLIAIGEGTVGLIETGND